MLIKKSVLALLLLSSAGYALSAEYPYKVVLKIASSEQRQPEKMSLFVNPGVEASIRMQKPESAEGLESRVTVSAGVDSRHVNLILSLARYDASGELVTTYFTETQVPLDATTQVLERQSSGGSEQVVVTVSLHPTGATY